jgi:hypothetical protein
MKPPLIEATKHTSWCTREWHYIEDGCQLPPEYLDTTARPDQPRVGVGICGPIPGYQPVPGVVLHVDGGTSDVDAAPVLRSAEARAIAANLISAAESAEAALIIDCAPWCQEINCHGRICFSDDADNVVVASNTDKAGSLFNVRMVVQRDVPMADRLTPDSVTSLQIGVATEADPDVDNWLKLTVDQAEELYTRLGALVREAKANAVLLREAGVS